MRSLLKTEEEVVRVLPGEPLGDGVGLRVAAVVAQKQAEGSLGFDAGCGPVGGCFAQQVEALLLVAADTGDADDHAKQTRQGGDGELLDAYGHLGIGVVGVELENLFAVVARGETLTGGTGVAVIRERDERGMHAPGVAAGEVGILVSCSIRLRTGSGMSTLRPLLRKFSRA